MSDDHSSLVDTLLQQPTAQINKQASKYATKMVTEFLYKKLMIVWFSGKTFNIAAAIIKMMMMIMMQQFIRPRYMSMKSHYKSTIQYTWFTR